MTKICLYSIISKIRKTFFHFNRRERQAMRIRLKDVAELAGVQPSTVSLVLNKHPKSQTFTSAVRQRIFDAAEKLGYRPNAAARALVTSRTYNIGFIVPEYAAQRWSNPFYAEFLNGIDDTCSKHNYSLMVHCCNPEKTVDFVFPRSVTERSIDGLIISNAISDSMLKLFEQLKVPCVRVGFTGKNDGSTLPVFGPDMLRGRILALEYLVRLGHRDVIFLNSGSQHTRNIAGQLEEHVRQSSLADRIKIHSVFTPDGKCDASAASIFFSNYFNFPEKMRPSAVITNPQTCLGILKEMEKYGMRCPHDLSLISNYNYEAFDFISPGITSLKYDNSVIGAYAAERLLEIIDSNAVKNISKPEFPVTLEIRQSCAQYVKTKRGLHERT